MPRYEYRCTACTQTSTVQHLMSETLEACPHCDVTDQLVKLVTRFRTPPKSSHSVAEPTGHLTEEYIKESRDELKLQKQELEKNR